MDIKLLTTLLLAIGAAILATDTPQAAPNRPLLGVIRWDGYTGSPYRFGPTDAAAGDGLPEAGEVAKPRTTDQEIEYAASAGIDYRAFCSPIRVRSGRS